jgi:hypothetical protein
LRTALAFHAFFAVVLLLAGGCRRAPSVRIEARRLDGPRPTQVALRCRASGLARPIKYTWKFSAGVKTIGWSVPTDEPVTLVQPPDAGAAWAECAAAGNDGVIVRALHALAPPLVAASPPSARAGQLIAVRGSGFGSARNEDDAIWLVPSWGRARPADHACKGAAWTDGNITACVPATLPPGRWQLRVEAGGELAGAATPLEVTP